MNIAMIPLLLVALLMASADTGLETVQLLVSGSHELDGRSGTVIVVDATARVALDGSAPGPVYVIGGDVVIAGDVVGDVVQLAGVVRVAPTATIGGELRHIGGTLSVSPDAEIGQRVSFPVVTETGRGPPSVIVTAVAAALLALLAATVMRRRQRALDNVAAAVSSHPVVTLTVGVLAALTFLAVFVFMAFTLVLLPVAAAGLLVGVAATAYGLAAVGHAVAARLPIDDPRRATPAGVVLVVVLVQVLALVPVVGDLLVLAILLTGLGAVLVTYFGAASLRVDVLPE